MGRRKQVPRSVHCEHIVLKAQQLFINRGIKATSMDDIAKEAGYSKATLYVYFKNKEEIVSILVLKSMEKLYDYIIAALNNQATTRARYDDICHGLLSYQEEYPFYFNLALDKINIDFENKQYLPEEYETYRVGEKINEALKQFFNEGIERNEICGEIDIIPTIFSFWGMLSGLINIAVNKEKYLLNEIGWTKEKFLKYGFDLLYHTLANEEIIDEK